MISDADRRYLALALHAAGQGRARTSPNPRVGCLVVKGDSVVATAWHERAGLPHAEARALAMAGSAAAGATLYGNLEPCCHHGRTPPCTDAIVAAGIARVVACHPDPNPKVSGGGFAALAAAGIACDHGALLEESLELNEPYLRSMQVARPFGILKAAMTLDGRIAPPSRDSKWITSHLAREHARALRAQVDAVAVGVGTLLADDPDLRPPSPADPPVLRLVVDSRLRTPPGARLLASAATDPVTIVTTHDAPREPEERLLTTGASVIRVAATSGGRVDLAAAAGSLYRQGIQSILYEGGGALHAGLLAAKLADRALLFVAPLAMGGGGGVSFVDRETPASLAEALPFPVRHTRRVGTDILHEADLYDRRALLGSSRT